jgi:hypothetical protein
MEVYEKEFRTDTKAGHGGIKAVQEKMEDAIRSSQEEIEPAINSIR